MMSGERKRILGDPTLLENVSPGEQFVYRGRYYVAGWLDGYCVRLPDGKVVEFALDDPNKKVRPVRC